MKPPVSLLYKSPTPSKHSHLSKVKTSTKTREAGTPTPHRITRPQSMNQSYDFSLDNSRIFNTLHKERPTKIKFDPDSVPIPAFDINICREEINRIASSVANEVLLENKIMREDWRNAKKSLDFQYIADLKENDRFNKELQINFKCMKENRERSERIEERRRKDEDFYAAKEAKERLEAEARKKERDDLERDKSKYLANQEVNEYKRQVRRFERSQERESFIEFVDVFKQRNTQEKTREEREREFEYAQVLSGKWIKLHQNEQQVKENIDIVQKLIRG